MEKINFQAKWIRASRTTGDVCPVFQKAFRSEKKVIEARLYLTALGVYEARLNGVRVSSDVLAPGWTAYEHRLQYQEYEITGLLREENELTVTVGKGWFSSPMPGWVDSEDKVRRAKRPRGIFGEICLRYEDGEEAVIPTDASWLWGESRIRFSEIYDGEFCDAAFETPHWENAQEFDWSTDILIPQEGEPIRERERVAAAAILRTPAGETVVDFGQEVTGYVEFTVDAHEGEKIRILHGEVLDWDGNFYNANYRSAKAEIRYICREGRQTWHPQLTFFGFRYILLDEFPGEPNVSQFTAIAVYSDIRRTGEVQCAVPEINRLFSNIFWGQRGNFVDVPTDCPQRDERLGWTGDVQVFVKAASYNFDVERFFRKWLRDLAADQRENGAVGQVIPDYLPEGDPSAAWGDVATICPWQIYLTYGNSEVLAEQFESMKKWVDYITSATQEAYLWTGGVHFGDWLGLDAPSGSYKGSTRDDFIATAFYAHSAELVAKAAQILGKEAEAQEYAALSEKIREAFRRTFPDYRTQTEHILAVQFGLAENPQKTADDLAAMVERDGCQLKTGFVGTPYILHVLSEYGHAKLAYTLFLRREYPSWRYPISRGATTIWEHWDGIMENGDFWSTDMNSFNHYAYGSVIDWVYEKAAGIHLLEEAPGFSRVKIAPLPDERLGWLSVALDTRHGRMVSRWSYEGKGVRYEITTPVEAEIVIGGESRQVKPGTYTFWTPAR